MTRHRDHQGRRCRDRHANPAGQAERPRPGDPWDLVGALRDVAADAGVRAVVLTGSGRAFCVGQDLAAVEELDHADETVAGSYDPIASTIAEMPKPVIAAVNGAAVGAGLRLALACACAWQRRRRPSPARSARWAWSRTPASLGIWSVSWATPGPSRWPRWVAPSPPSRPRTTDWSTEVLPADELAAGARELAGLMAAGPAHALTLTKRQFRAVGDQSFASILSDLSMFSPSEDLPRLLGG